MAIVYPTDTFTVEADTNLDAYSGGSASYSYNNGSGSNLLVVAATDKVKVNVTNTDADARSNANGIPTGNQESSADVQLNTGGDREGRLCVRMATDGTKNYYISYSSTAPATSQIYRCDAGTFTQLASITSPHTTGVHRVRLRATGTDQVDLEAQIDGFTKVTASDSSVNRKTSGVGGFGGFDDTGVGDVTIDNFSISDTNTRQINRLRPRIFAPGFPR